MAPSENLEPLPLPIDEVWTSIGVVCGPELHGGHQSRVFAAERGGEAVVVKLTDSRLVDDAFGRRLAVTAALAKIDASVVGPVRLNAVPMARLGGWLAAVYPFIEGRAPDIRNEADVRRMASTMASLHRSLDELGPVDLPAVAALAGTRLSADAEGFGRFQLLHGDFSHTNLMFSEHQVHTVDFDDCGYGPVEFDVGNTLYMVLFDAATSSEMVHYERFREWFVDEYRSASGHACPIEAVNESIRLRVQALGRWVKRPESAPIGIRTATTAWRDSLRAFVRSQSGD